MSPLYLLLLRLLPETTNLQGHGHAVLTANSYIVSFDRAVWFPSLAHFLFFLASAPAAFHDNWFG